MDIFKVVGTYVVDNDQALKAIDETTGKANQSSGKLNGAFEKVGAATVKMAKVAAAGVAAIGTGVAAITKSAVSSYAEYEQLVGGVETLFKNNSDKVLKYAENAYKTAGLSANDYMNTVTSFSASLLQGLDGDTEKAAEKANLAITDMSDNANKMGTDIGMIQNAYQGFAKQNYTMLDNLKLGYGGTQAEMARLINDSGVLGDSMKVTAETVNTVSFDKVIEAIHVVQTEIGITGTTALEASTTIEGSANAMKGAWENLLVGLADGNQDLDGLIKALVDSVVTYASNLIPRIQQTLQSIGNVVRDYIPKLLEKANSLIPKTSVLFDLVLDEIEGFADKVAAAAPGFLKSGLAMIQNLVKGIMDSLPTLISRVPEIISKFANVINDNAPTILKAGFNIVVTIVKGIISAIPTLIANIPKIITAIVDVWEAFNWLSLGKNAMNGLKNGIEAMKANVKSAGTKICNAITNSMKNLPSNLKNLGKSAIHSLGNTIGSLVSSVKIQTLKVVSGIETTFNTLPKKLLSIGKDIVKGLWNGISDMTGWVVNKIKGFGDSILSGIKDFFDIHSPSRVMRDQVGKQLALGVAEGIDKNKKYAEKSAKEMAEITLQAAEKRLDRYKTYNDMSLSNEVSYWNTIRKTIKKGTDARLQADKNYLEAKKSLNEQLLAADQTYSEKCKEINKQLKEDIKSLKDEYAQSVKDRTSAILSAFSLFESYQVGETVEGSTLIDGLQTQVDALDTWRSEIATLKGKMENTTLFETIQQMGVDSLAQVKALNSMTEEELAKYEELYKQRETYAKKQATGELKEEKDAMLAEIETLNKQADTELKSAYNTWVNTYADLGVKVGGSMKKTVTTVNKNLTTLNNNVTTQMNKAVKTVNNAVTKLKNAMKFEWSLPHLKLPHVSISGAFSLNPPSAPTFSVEWYKKGGIMMNPTMFGLNPFTGNAMVGGEAGAEAIAPIDVLQGYVAEAVKNSNDRLEQLMEQQNALLAAILAKDNNTYLDGEKITSNVNKRLGFAL